MKHILIIIGLVVSLAAQAQKDTIKTATSDVGIETMVAELGEKRAEIKHLNDSIVSLYKERTALNQQWTDSIKQLMKAQEATLNQWKDSVALRDKQIALWQDSVAQRDKKIAQLIQEKAQMKKAQDATVKLTDIVFKQCLLYPLEGPYDSLLVKESLESLEAMNISTNPKYEKYSKVYLHLLKDYQRYNQEFIDFLTQQFRSFKFKGYKINNFVAEGTLKDLQMLTYYKYYAKRNQDPWESILYLDGVIETFEKMLGTPESLTEENCNEVLNKLLPKK